MSDNSKQAYVFLDVSDASEIKTIEGDQFITGGLYEWIDCEVGAYASVYRCVRRPVTLATPKPVGQTGPWDAYALEFMKQKGCGDNFMAEATLAASFADEMMRRRPKEGV